MFKRNLLYLLDKWKNSSIRKPLIIRGARQTGKTVVVHMFSEAFTNFIYIDLEKEADKNLFEKSSDLKQIIQAIEIAKNKKLEPNNTLLFIDEIQNSPNAIKMLRYFHEDYPEIAVIAAGSLLEAIMKHEGFSFPVGRVEFLYLHPLTFDEFLLALGEDKLISALTEVTLNNPPSASIHDIALKFFHQYLLVGGMPEAVQDYAEHRSFQSLIPIKEGLLRSFEEDTAKYSRSSNIKYLKHVINYAPNYVGERIKYENFGGAGYRSREMKKAFDLLEYAMIIQRVYGSHVIAPPIKLNFNVSPKLIYIDVGLVAYRMGLTEDALYISDLNDLFRGALAEQIVGQTFNSTDMYRKIELSFWYRNRPGSTAETDYLIQHQRALIPVEVKSGKSGRMRSLAQFSDMSKHSKACRLYSGKLYKEKVSCGKNKSYSLLSIPLYLQWRLKYFLDEWID